MKSKGAIYNESQSKDSGTFSDTYRAETAWCRIGTGV